MERTNSFINVWFWARNDGSVPDNVKYGASNIVTDNWVRGFRVELLHVKSADLCPRGPQVLAFLTRTAIWPLTFVPTTS
jgi:hypothetical protein